MKMRLHSLLRTTLIVLLACAMTPVWANDAFETLLGEADAVRTSDARRFAVLLDQLDRQVEGATTPQRQRLALLRAHRLMSTGESAAAIAKLKPLATGAEDVTLRFLAGSMLANTYAITRQFEEGLVAIEAMLALQADVKDRDVLHRGLMVAGLTYSQVGEYATARHYAVQVLEGDPLPRTQCAANNLLLEAALGLNERIADEDAQAAIRHCDELKEPIMAGFSRTYLAKSMFVQGRTREAIELLEGYLPRVEDTGYPTLIGQYHAMLAEYRMKLGDIDRADRHARAAISMASSIASSLPLVVAYRTLYEIAMSRGDDAAALNAHLRYAQADKAHFNDMKSREMAYQVVRHQSQQQAQQIQLLSQKNQLLQLQKRVTEQRAQSWLLVAVLLVFLTATISYWAYKTKRLQMRLKRMAEIDTLTCISNRHHFTQKSEKALAQCLKEGRVVALLMFDLDHFKQVNDRFGHAAGDWALKEIAAACMPLSGPEDCLCRLGGEEFAILLPGYDMQMARRLAADALARFSRIDAASNGYDFKLTASFGVTDTSMSGHDLTRMLSHADKAMYRAKRAGRNRICMFEEGNATMLPFSIEAPTVDPDLDAEVARRRNLALS